MCRGVADYCLFVHRRLALARILHSVGAKVIIAGRDIQKLQQLKFTLDANTHGTMIKVGEL